MRAVGKKTVVCLIGTQWDRHQDRFGDSPEKRQLWKTYVITCKVLARDMGQTSMTQTYVYSRA